MPDLLDQLANLFWEHPKGDVLTLPCPHIVFDHPGGDQIRVPCTHGLKQEHPAGDPITTPCLHLGPAHAQGHPITVPCTHGLRQEHPGGDRVGFVTLPCIHVSLVHPSGDTVNLPCPHLVPQHPSGDTNFLPCPHVSLVHPEGDLTTVPCVHPRQEHPAGHPGPPLPCAHPLPIRRAEFGGRLLFYTDDTEIQGWMIAIVQGLMDLGVDITLPRPLHVFNRPAVNGNPNDNLDPFWSHYNPLFHSIQLTDGHTSEDNLSTALHECGHALLGHSIPNHFASGPHTGTSPNLNADGSLNTGLAMSEGWADFVALVLENRLHLGSSEYAPGALETSKLKPSPATDRCVAAALWDLFDPVGVEPGMVQDRVSLPFSEMLRVYSPGLQTLTSGPVISSIFDFANRLKENNQRTRGLATRVDEVLTRNVGKQP
jgi:hypothetical protein